MIHAKRYRSESLIKRAIIIVSLAVLLPVSGWCEYNEISVATTYQELQQQINDILNQLPGSVRQSFQDGRRNHKQTLSRKHQRLKSHYTILKEKLEYWQPAYELSQALNQLYLAFHLEITDEEKWAIAIECDDIAKQLIGAIMTLRKEYKVGAFPRAHNLMIDLGLKKRGACKHWAEDLLRALEGVDHPHFTAYWGEAFPGTIKEHNVAILVPYDANFNDGLIIDPWRTAGIPFWIKVKEDNHPWKPWKGYQER